MILLHCSEGLNYLLSSFDVNRQYIYEPEKKASFFPPFPILGSNVILLVLKLYFYRLMP